VAFTKNVPLASCLFQREKPLSLTCARNHAFGGCDRSCANQQAHVIEDDDDAPSTRYLDTSIALILQILTVTREFPGPKAGRAARPAVFFQALGDQTDELPNASAISPSWDGHDEP
jgi:hypothetical protein